MSHSEREEFRDRVVRTVWMNTGAGGPDALDADHIRVHLCANAGYLPEQVNRGIAAALEAGKLTEVDGGYTVSGSA